MKIHPVESHFLYGEPVREVEPRFLHVEPIRFRSHRHHWTIEPHTHANLHQILFVTAGGGEMQNEGVLFSFGPPAFLIVPAASVHAFHFRPDTDGWVVTFADSLLSEVAGGQSAVLDLLRVARSCQPVGERAAGQLTQAFEGMAQELVWSAPGRALAIQAELIRILVSGTRLVVENEEQDVRDSAADVTLVERFRRLVEEEFRNRLPISTFAARLGVSDGRLLAACQRRYGEPPKKVLHRRVLVEAQRWLLYTGMPIGEIGRELGFEDPAYFSRFFTKSTGQSPRAYRRNAGGK